MESIFVDALMAGTGKAAVRMLGYGLAYMEQSEEAYAEQVRERLEKQLRR